MRKNILIITALALLAGASCKTGTAAHEPGRAPSPELQYRHILRTYEVPEGHEREVKRLLIATSYPISVVSAGGTQTQFVPINPQFTGGRYFILSAPESIHQGIEGMLAVVGSRPAPVPRVVTVTYWLVLGYPDGAPAASAQLTEIAKALEALSALGPLRFELLERLQIRSLDGEDAKVSGRFATIEQTPALDGRRIELRLEAEVRGDAASRANLATALSLDAGQFAVIGQVGFKPERSGDGPAGESPTLFWVARAEVVE